MSYESDFNEFMPATVTHKPHAGTDANGVDVYSSQRTIQARIELIRQKVIDRTGVERVSDTTLFLRPTDGDDVAVSIDHGDYLALPSAYTTEVRPILQVDRQDDDEGLHHWEVLL